MGRRVQPARSGQPRTVRRLVVTLGEERFRSASSTLSIRVLTAEIWALRSRRTPSISACTRHHTPRRPTKPVRLSTRGVPRPRGRRRQLPHFVRRDDGAMHPYSQRVAGHGLRDNHPGVGIRTQHQDFASAVADTSAARRLAKRQRRLVSSVAHADRGTAGSGESATVAVDRSGADARGHTGQTCPSDRTARCPRRRVRRGRTTAAELHGRRRDGRCQRRLARQLRGTRRPPQRHPAARLRQGHTSPPAGSDLSPRGRPASWCDRNTRIEVDSAALAGAEGWGRTQTDPSRETPRPLHPCRRSRLPVRRLCGTRLRLRCPPAGRRDLRRTRTRG